MQRLANLRKFSSRSDSSLLSSPKYFSARHSRPVLFHDTFQSYDLLPLFGLQWVLRSFHRIAWSICAVCHVPETTTIFYHHMCDRVGCRFGYSFVSLIDVFLLLRFVIARVWSVACKNAIFIDDAFCLFFQARTYRPRNNIDLFAKKKYKVEMR